MTSKIKRMPGTAPIQHLLSPRPEILKDIIKEARAEIPEKAMCVATSLEMHREWRLSGEAYLRAAI